jgi:hypothetical protein
MNHIYWQNTNFDTNIAESAHAQAQRDGKHLTLVGAIEKGEEIDARFFGARNARRLMGVQVRYGDNSIGGNAKKNINRAKAAEKSKQRRQKEKEKESEKEKEKEQERAKEREEQLEQERTRQQKTDENLALLTSTVMQLSQTVQRLSDMKE